MLSMVSRDCHVQLGVIKGQEWGEKKQERVSSASSALQETMRERERMTHYFLRVVGERNRNRTVSTKLKCHPLLSLMIDWQNLVIVEREEEEEK